MNQYPDFDQKLYDDLRRGKEYAFAAVFDRYHRLLYTIAYRFLKSEEEAEDAVQYLFHFKNAYERDVLPRNSSLQSSDIDKKDQNVFKKARYLFQKVPVVI